MLCVLCTYDAFVCRLFLVFRRRFLFFIFLFFSCCIFQIFLYTEVFVYRFSATLHYCCFFPCCFVFSKNIHTVGEKQKKSCLFDNFSFSLCFFGVFKCVLVSFALTWIKTKWKWNILADFFFVNISKTQKETTEYAFIACLFLLFWWLFSFCCRRKKHII